MEHRLKRKGDIVLIPQPSDDVNDPLNWPMWKKSLAFSTIIIFTFMSIWAVAGLGVAILILTKQFGRDLNTTAQGLNGFPVLTFGCGVNPFPLVVSDYTAELFLGSHRSVHWKTSRIPTCVGSFLRLAHLVGKSIKFQQFGWCSYYLCFCWFLHGRTCSSTNCGSLFPPRKGLVDGDLYLLSQCWCNRRKSYSRFCHRRFGLAMAFLGNRKTCPWLIVALQHYCRNRCDCDISIFP